MDLASWSIPYMVVDTRNWLPGRKVLVATGWIEDIDWAGRQVHVGLSQEEIRSSPEYEPGATPDPDYEQRLHSHYGRPFGSGPA